MRNKTVLISGASIAGPALAYWLDHYGFDATVVERAPALRPGGQAVDFKGRTHFTVLERMGVLDEIRQHRTGTTDTVFVDANGKQVGFLSGDFTGGDVEILRGDLAAILYRRTEGKCEYLFSDSIAALTKIATGVHVEFERGPARTFDLVVGADGIHSRVRALSFGPEHEYVKHLGYFYCVAGTSPWSVGGTRERQVAYGHNAPGRLAIHGGAKAQQLYMFASPEVDLARHDGDTQRRLLAQMYADVSWEVPRMLTEMTEFDDFYLDSVGRVGIAGGYTRGRIALVGDSAYGNTLAGFGTGLAVVGAYVLAGELAVARGEHTMAFDRYNRIMKGYAAIAGNSNAGRFLAPRTARGIRMRNWFLGSSMFALMRKYADRASNDIDLRDYPAMIAAAQRH